MRFSVNQSNQIPQKVSPFSIFKTDSEEALLFARQRRRLADVRLDIWLEQFIRFRRDFAIFEKGLKVVTTEGYGASSLVPLDQLSSLDWLIEAKIHCNCSIEDAPHLANCVYEFNATVDQLNRLGSQIDQCGNPTLRETKAKHFKLLGEQLVLIFKRLTVMLNFETKGLSDRKIQGSDDAFAKLVHCNI
jgi:hypothetical protein